MPPLKAFDLLLGDVIDVDIDVYQEDHKDPLQLDLIEDDE